MENTKIYFIQSECNDKGWMTGFRYYKNLDDAIVSMRRYVAYYIRTSRMHGCKITHLHVWRDSPVGLCDCNVASQSVTFKETLQDGSVRFWDFRIFAADLLDKPNPKDKCFNY